MPVLFSTAFIKCRHVRPKASVAELQRGSACAIQSVPRKLLSCGAELLFHWGILLPPPTLSYEKRGGLELWLIIGRNFWIADTSIGLSKLETLAMIPPPLSFGTGSDGLPNSTAVQAQSRTVPESRS